MGEQETIARYLPTQDAELDDWLANFAAHFQVHARDLGFTDQEAAAISQASADWHTDYSSSRWR